MAPNNDEKGWFLGSLWNSVSGFFEIGFEKVWTGYINVLVSVGTKLLEFTTAKTKTVVETAWTPLVNFYKERGWIDKQTEQELNKLKDIYFPFNILAFTISLAGIWLTYVKQTMYIFGSDLRRKMFTEGQPTDAQAGDILQAMFTKPDTTPKIREILRNQGLPPEQIDLIFTAVQRLYDEGIIKDLYLRGVLDEAGLYKRFRQLGYKDKQIAELIQTFPVIPGPGDLFHLVAKEAFEPDMIEHYGYDEEFPEEQVKWLKMQGISDYWAKKYWYAHWDVPSIGQGFEMYQRGVIDFPELWDLFRTIEIPPFWREKLTEIAFMPYTRVDVRRMHAMGTLSDDELIRSYQDVGFSPEKALKMAEFTIQFNKQSEKDLTRAQVLDGYKDDLISQQDTQALLIEMGYDSTEASYFISSTDFDKVKDIEKIKLNNVQDKFQNNLIDEFDTREQLSILNLEGSRIEALIEKWKLSILENAKLPSRADLDKFLAAKVITQPIYREQMTKLGYEHKYIEWYLAAVSKK